jgi:predicted flap endonuclease-1-like 5' DNA nuclease
VGAKFAAKLNENGIARFDQLAALDDQAAAALDERMGAFRGRLARDRVIEQARFLAQGDTAGFEGTFGKLGSGAPIA